MKFIDIQKILDMLDKLADQIHEAQNQPRHAELGPWERLLFDQAFDKRLPPMHGAPMFNPAEPIPFVKDPRRGL